MHLDPRCGGLDNKTHQSENREYLEVDLYLIVLVFWLRNIKSVRSISRFLLIYQKQQIHIYIYISKCTPFSTIQPLISLIHDTNCKKDFTPQASQFGICVLVKHPEVHRISYNFVFKIQFPLSNTGCLYTFTI